LWKNDLDPEPAAAAYTFDFARKVTLAVPEDSPDNVSFQGRFIGFGSVGVFAFSDYPEWKSVV
jgi:hypothetical protein